MVIQLTLVGLSHEIRLIGIRHTELFELSPEFLECVMLYIDDLSRGIRAEFIEVVLCNKGERCLVMMIGTQTDTTQN